MRYIAIVAAAAALLVNSPAHADSLKEGYPICASDNLLDQMYEAILQKDKAGMDYLLTHGCFMTKQGVRVSLLDRGDWGTRAHVRIYKAGDGVEAWTSIGALESYQP